MEKKPNALEAFEAIGYQIDNGIFIRTVLVADSGVPREELFVTTKLWNSWTKPMSKLNSFKSSLEKSGLDYLIRI